MEELNTNQKKEGVVGPSIAIAIILIVIVLGGVYYWSTISSEINSRKEAANTNTNTSETVQMVIPTATSTEIDDLLKDANNIDPESLGSESNNL